MWRGRNDQTDRFTWLEIRERLLPWSCESEGGEERRIHQLSMVPVETRLGLGRGTIVSAHNGVGYVREPEEGTKGQHARTERRISDSSESSALYLVDRHCDAWNREIKILAAINALCTCFVRTRHEIKFFIFYLAKLYLLEAERTIT